MTIRTQRKLFIFLAGLLVLVFVQFFEQSVPFAEVPIGLVPVIRVVDGDTVILRIDGEEETIRIIGINTPETVDPRRPVECFGKEASARAHELLNDQYVRVMSNNSHQ